MSSVHLLVSLPNNPKFLSFYASDVSTNEVLFFSYQIIFGVVLSWIICAIITAADGFTNDQSNPQYRARTDARIFVLKDAKWFRFPYPGTRNGRAKTNLMMIYGVFPDEVMRSSMVH